MTPIHDEPLDVRVRIRKHGAGGYANPTCDTCGGYGVVVPKGGVWWGLCPDCARPRVYEAAGLTPALASKQPPEGE